MCVGGGGVFLIMVWHSILTDGRVLQHGSNTGGGGSLARQVRLHNVPHTWSEDAAYYLSTICHAALALTTCVASQPKEETNL